MGNDKAIIQPARDYYNILFHKEGKDCYDTRRMASDTVFSILNSWRGYKKLKWSLFFTTRPTNFYISNIIISLLNLHVGWGMNFLIWLLNPIGITNLINLSLQINFKLGYRMESKGRSWIIMSAWSNSYDRY